MTNLDPFEPVQHPVTKEEIALIQKIFKDAGNEISEAEAEIEVRKLRHLADTFMKSYDEEMDKEFESSKSDKEREPEP